MNRGTAIRAGGVALTVGSIAWAITLLVTEPAPDATSPSPTLEILGGFAYQIGLAGLLLAVWLTRALGHVRGARVVFVTEAALLALASVWSLVYAIDFRTQAHPVMVVLDATWPLSMVGLIVLGVYLALARVWPTPIRQLALVASLWIPLDLAAMLIGGDTAGLAFRVTWLVVVWGALGVLIAVNGPRLGTSRADPTVRDGHSARRAQPTSR